MPLHLVVAFVFVVAFMPCTLLLPLHVLPLCFCTLLWPSHLAPYCYFCTCCYLRACCSHAFAPCCYLHTCCCLQACYLRPFAPCCCLRTLHLVATFTLIVAFVRATLVSLRFTTFKPCYCVCMCCPHALLLHLRYLLPTAPLLFCCLVIAFAPYCLVPCVSIGTPSQISCASEGAWSNNHPLIRLK
jgi:hypothetical protein